MSERKEDEWYHNGGNPEGMTSLVLFFVGLPILLWLVLTLANKP